MGSHRWPGEEPDQSRLGPGAVLRAKQISLPVGASSGPVGAGSRPIAAGSGPIGAVLGL